MVARIHGGNLGEVARRYGLDSKKILDFSSNINPDGPPKAVINYLGQVKIEDVVNYPDMDCEILRSVLAKNLGLKERNLLITNGSSEAIFLLANHFRPKKALVISPTFCEYEIAVVSTGGKIENLNLQRDKNFALSLDSMMPQLKEVEMLFLCNPNNPTGNIYSRDTLIKLLEKTNKEGVFCVIDEAFIDFAEDKESYTLKPLVNDFNNFAVLGSLTKFYSLAGLRIGYIVSGDVLISELKSRVPAWNVNAIAQKAAILALKDRVFEQSTFEKNTRARDRLFSLLTGISYLKAYPSQANFLLVEINRDAFDLGEFYSRLLRRSFYVRNCASFDGLSERFFRVAVRSEEENLKLVEAIKEILT